MPSILTDDLLDRPEGGSLNSIAFRGESVIKRYTGNIPRGYEKLKKEYCWLQALPPNVAQHFATPTDFIDRSDPRLVELRLRREDKEAVAKGILRGLISPESAQIIVARALGILVTELYPLRREPTCPGLDVYHTYHAPRIDGAIAQLRTYPEIGAILDSPTLVVNGQPCPPFSLARAWMHENAHFYFAGSHLVTGHGDLHLDNILASLELVPTLTLIDPRGDALLPPHYDFAKMSKALRSAYDRIHYGLFEMDVTTNAGVTDIRLDVDDCVAEHYSRGLHELIAALPAYADAEGVSPGDFCRATLATEWAHTISFTWYHANHSEGRDVKRVTAYLAVAALMIRELMEIGPDRIPTLELPLL